MNYFQKFINWMNNLNKVPTIIYFDQNGEHSDNVFDIKFVFVSDLLDDIFTECDKSNAQGITCSSVTGTKMYYPKTQILNWETL